MVLGSYRHLKGSKGCFERVQIAGLGFRERGGPSSFDSREGGGGGAGGSGEGRGGNQGSLSVHA